LSISILVPVWNDWECAQLLCREIISVLPAQGIHPAIWLVDDGSSEAFAEPGLPDGVSIIRLRKHYGHQRAIAAGLGQLQHTGQVGEAVVVMDGDGEDSVHDLPRMFSEWKKNPQQVVVALRRKRESKLLFRLGYALYRVLFFVATGHRFNFGNFVLLPPSAVETLCASPYTTRHLAASVLRLKLPYRGVVTDRGRRYFGHSRMSWQGLVRHALAAFAVYFGLSRTVATPTDCARELIAFPAPNR
jgi:hypothetical protein